LLLVLLLVLAQLLAKRNVELLNPGLLLLWGQSLEGPGEVLSLAVLLNVPLSFEALLLKTEILSLKSLLLKSEVLLLKSLLLESEVLALKSLLLKTEILSLESLLGP